MTQKQFKEGEVLRFIRVRFPGQASPGTFLLEDDQYVYGQKVVAMSERGPAVGFINSRPFEYLYDPNMGNPQRIMGPATPEEEAKLKDLYQEQRKAKDIFLDLVEKRGLPMKFQDMEFSEGGEKVTFLYTAPERVDFRELLRDLGRELGFKIELRQISSSLPCQDIGPCGMELCTFVNSVMPAGKKRCNEFYCRLDHKDPFYEDKKARLPRVGDYVSTKTGEIGRVEKVELWKEEFVLLTSEGVRKKYVGTLFEKTLNKKGIVFPKFFENIVDETRTLIGDEGNS